MLDEAEDLLGPSPALDHDRPAVCPGCRSGTGTRVPAAFGLGSFRPGRSTFDPAIWPRAAEEFQAALDSARRTSGRTSTRALPYRLGRFDDAVDAFRVCIALAPETAECFYNRALAHAALGQTPWPSATTPPSNATPR